jgi:hypothetical protein
MVLGRKIFINKRPFRLTVVMASGFIKSKQVLDAIVTRGVHSSPPRHLLQVSLTVLIGELFSKTQVSRWQIQQGLNLPIKTQPIRREHFSHTVSIVGIFPPFTIF